MKTKDKILKQALFQFNSEGVERVTTSSLAKNMGISLGNLHYHFPNRDSIIQHLIDEFIAHEEVLSKKLLQTPAENFITHLFTVQLLTFKSMWEYRFIFSDRLVIKRRTNYLEIRFMEMIRLRKIEFDRMVSELQSKGIIFPEISRKVLDAYFTQLVIGNNSWIAYSELFPSDLPPYHYFAESAIWSWKPYLNYTDNDLEEAMKNALVTMENY